MIYFCNLKIELIFGWFWYWAIVKLSCAMDRHIWDFRAQSALSVILRNSNTNFKILLKHFCICWTVLLELVLKMKKIWNFESPVHIFCPFNLRFCQKFLTIPPKALKFQTSFMKATLLREFEVFSYRNSIRIIQLSLREGFVKIFLP